ncbi:hypothetical protein OG871_02185 [Kitasatospora sp. NBC_00374]|uniref:hypothetical protein n=1 Tax=Kitasatospora sp. NBC_00374 TaxID=2975964 RepID=UPI0032507CB7
MTTLAVTGHMDLTEGSVPLIRAALRGVLQQYTHDGVTGLSCIARGADTLFAEELLAVGGRLVVIVPSRDYRRTVVGPDHAPVFDRLLEAAAEVVTLPHETADRDAYEAANLALIHGADRLVAVWDGRPPTGKGGGTADAVAAARAAGLDVDVVWPDGAARQDGPHPERS